MHGVAALCWLEGYRKAATQIARADNLEIASQVISSGDGIGVIPCFFAARHPEMISVFPERIECATGWIVYHESARDTARVRTVADALIGFFESNAELFAGQMGTK